MSWIKKADTITADVGSVTINLHIEYSNGQVFTGYDGDDDRMQEFLEIEYVEEVDMGMGLVVTAEFASLEEAVANIEQVRSQIINLAKTFKRRAK